MCLTPLRTMAQVQYLSVHNPDPHSGIIMFVGPVSEVSVTANVPVGQAIERSSRILGTAGGDR